MSENKNYFEMSDEELLNQLPPEFEDDESEELSESDESDEELETVDEVDDAASDEDELDESDSDDANEEPASEDYYSDDTDTPSEDAPQDEEALADEDDEAASSAADKTKATEKDEVGADSDTDGVDYQAVYERIFAPFTANGRQIQAKSPEDVIQLMQMGANYHKKMRGLKPSLRILKMLEKNELLDEQKLSYLIDLSKKDPKAIAQLVKDSGLDPMDIDTEAASEYQPNTYTVDDREIELDNVLDEIQNTPTFKRTLDVVGNKWDTASKNLIGQTPQILRVINDHIASGIYDIIDTEVARQRALGRLSGLSDLEAYKQVGDFIESQGGFNHLFENQAPTETAKESTPRVNKAEENRRKQKRRAAGSTKTRSTPAPKDDFNPLALSDQDFEKLDAVQF